MRGNKIKHIVFDLGGVIVNLDPGLTIVAFSKMSGKSIEKVAEYARQNELFHLYEKGLISNVDFRKGIRGLLEVKASDERIDEAWNAMLLDVPSERLGWLSSLKDNYHITILSNTNDIHISQVHHDLLKNHGLPDFSSLADRVYYSHMINLRKPNADIYQYVLDNGPYTPEETLFLDDSETNILGAQSVNIRTIHVTDPNLIPTLLNDAGIQF